jgi:phosphoribosylanthranilate isomerase
LTRIKMCGLMEPEDLNLAIKAGADAVGFVVEIEKSRHCLSRQEARSLIGRVPVFTKSVAVISPKSVEDAAALAQDTGVDVLQVHGGLTLEEIRMLKGRVHQKVVTASSPDAAVVRPFGRVADAVLLDTFKDGQLGGSGAVHDWDLSASLVRELSVPVILAGGLNPANVREAVQKVRPYAVDVSSGIETGGRKDASKMADFVREVRSCL